LDFSVMATSKLNLLEWNGLALGCQSLQLALAWMESENPSPDLIPGYCKGYGAGQGHQRKQPLVAGGIRKGAG
jgi:hypothetical protein